MPAKPKTYAQAVEAARAGLAAARLADPDEHFPYKIDAVLELLDANPNMGPGTPDGPDGVDDTSRDVSDYMSREIAAASEAYVAAQEAYLRDHNPENRAAFEAARDELVAARLDHRQNRGQGFTIGAAARKAG